MAAFLPKQAKVLLEGRNKVTTYNATGGVVTAQFAAHNLSLIPTIPSGSIIHDNMAGDGTVARKILTSDSAPSDIKIYATDHDQEFLDVLKEDVTANSWPVEVSNQKAEALSFADDFFTHSITNVGIFMTPSAGLDGAKEIYRTLKPGGIAVANCWEFISWFMPIMIVTKTTRPGPPSGPPPVNWADGEQLKKIFLGAGFAEENIKLEKSEAWAKTTDLKDWCEKTWAYLASVVAPWKESDEERWDEAVELLTKTMGGLPEAQGVKVVDGETWLRTSQWAIVATK